jgi:aminoglycoside 2'-N-acetyltransferase I
MSVDGIAVEVLPESGWDKVAHINKLVYPPENPITAVWASLQWADADQRFVALKEGEAVCHVGLFFRDALRSGKPARISGIGGVMTHPAHQKRGYARHLLALAHEEAQRKKVDFALLVCEPKNVGFYQDQGWQVFAGHMIHQQQGKSVNWTLSPVMVRDVAVRAPRGGMVDLRGKPW